MWYRLLYFRESISHEAVELNQKDPNKINCPQDKKVDITFLICGVSLDCESVEFGCSALLSWSFKKNFVNKSTTTFIGVGAELGVGVAKGEVKAGFTVTKSANGDIDVGVKGEATGKLLGAIGKNYEATVTVSEGLRTDAKDVVGFGL